MMECPVCGGKLVLRDFMDDLRWYCCENYDYDVTICEGEYDE